jgi:hypothetical protein
MLNLAITLKAYAKKQSEEKEINHEFNQSANVTKSRKSPVEEHEEHLVHTKQTYFLATRRTNTMKDAPSCSSGVAVVCI